MRNKLNIVFMGTPEFSVPTLEKLFKEENVIAVYTREPKPQGRKMILTKSQVHQKADSLNIPVFTPKNFKNDLDVQTLKNLNPDMIIVAAYGLILPKSVLDIPTLGCINIHASLLPLLRGANPIQRSIINGDKKNGITIMKMDEGMDTGDMLLKDEIEITSDMTYGELEIEMSKIGSNLILKYLENFENIKPIKQPSDFTLAPKLKKEETKINWNKSSSEIHNLIRALSPYPFANFTHNENIIKILKSETIDETTLKQPGEVLNFNMDIACGDGKILRVLEIQKIGSKPMNIKDFLNGYKIEIGEILK